MATLISGNTALNMNNLGFVNFLSAIAFSANATTAQAVYADGSFQLFSGSFVLDGSGHLTGGTINAITEIKAGDAPYVITGLSYPVTSFLTFLNAANGPGLIADMFSGADSITGSIGNDILSGFDGKDTLAGGNGDDSISGGTGNDVLVGDDGNDTLDGGVGNDTMDGGAGNDTYVADSFNDLAIEISSSGNDTVLASADYQLANGIENLTLTGAAQIGVGNELNNVVTGNGSNNELYCLEGNDTISGGDGKDSLLGGEGHDSLLGGGGNDYLGGDVFAGNGNDTLDGGTGDDELEGGEGNDSIAGGLDDDALFGDDGNDTLDGGAGADFLNGGKGDDVYLISDTLDAAVEFGSNSGGIDTVLASVDYQLEDAQFGIENLVLKGSAEIGFGNELNNVITGNAGANFLFGDDGDDTINGDGGADDLYGDEGNDSISGGLDDDALSGNDGNDTLDGGAGTDFLNGGKGDDVYLISDTLDAAVEFGTNSGGIDIVLASVDYRLEDAQFGIENLVLTGSATFGVGNSLNNVITGNAGDNELFGADGNDTVNGGVGIDTLLGGDGADLIDGGEGDDTLYGDLGASEGAGNDTLDGGAGADSMNGGQGDDIYIVDDIGDITYEDDEDDGGGNDTVHALIDFMLSAGISSVENLTLIGTAQTGEGNEFDNALTGNELDNLLLGYDGNDTLDGGDGEDFLSGGAGDDTYIVAGANDDTIAEDADAGIDTVESHVGFLALAENVENLILGDGAEAGEGNGLANKIIGNDLDNTILGNGGDDTLDGGIGNDILSGGAGNDTYFVDEFSDEVDEFDEFGEEFGGGVDTVFSTAFQVQLGQNIENLVLLSGAGDGVGNELDNQITGNEDGNLLLGFDGNDTLDGGLGADFMNGGLGDDLYLVDDEFDAVAEFEEDGGIDTVQSTSVFYALGSGIENLVLKDIAWFGGGNELDNVVTGNDSENSLEGGDGNDTMQAGDGYDFLNGNAGNDVLDGGDKDDDLTGGEDNDSVSGGNDSDTLDGGQGNDTLNGDAGDDILLGDEGGDVIDGGSGGDSLLGGAGDDTFYFDDIQDFAAEFVDEGIDTIHSSVTVSLIERGGYIENITLLGTDDIDATGDSLSNFLTGNAGDNRFEGLGGLDTMAGGAGNDTYFVIGGEVIVENLNEGIDTVQAQTSYQLAANIENLTAYVGHGGIEGKGNELNNVMTSNDVGASLYGLNGADTMIGGDGADTLIGGTGADSMAGGAGDDVYGVDGKSDVVTELSGDGHDTVQSSIDYELGANFEDLVLLDGATLGSGNGGDNFILGNSGINGLFGGAGNDTLDGGAGMDLLVGGAGNDSYFVDHALDGVLEGAGGGVDTVSSLVTYTLGGNIENLTLLGSVAINGNGNGLANLMIGNDGANRLRGLGGADTLDGGLGADTHTGGAGRDVFLRHGIGEGQDVVTDFTTGGSGDLLDIGDMLVGYVPGSSVIGDFVQTLQSGGNTILQVDADGGANGSSFTSVFVLSGVTTTVNDLVANGNLALA